MIEGFLSDVFPPLVVPLRKAFKGDYMSDSEALEAFSIAFKEVDNGVHLVMGWGTTRVAVPISM